MPVDCRIPATHPDRPEILRLLTEMEIPGDVMVTISPSLGADLGWDLKAVTPRNVWLCGVSMTDGPAGVLSAVRRLLADG